MAEIGGANEKAVGQRNVAFAASLFLAAVLVCGAYEMGKVDRRAKEAASAQMHALQSNLDGANAALIGTQAALIEAQKGIRNTQAELASTREALKIVEDDLKRKVSEHP